MDRRQRQTVATLVSTASWTVLGAGTLLIVLALLGELWI